MCNCICLFFFSRWCPIALWYWKRRLERFDTEDTKIIYVAWWLTDIWPLMCYFWFAIQGFAWKWIITCRVTRILLHLYIVSRQLETLLDIWIFTLGVGWSRQQPRTLCLYCACSRGLASPTDANSQYSRDCGKPAINQSSSVVVVLDTTVLMVWVASQCLTVWV